jgi:hypothetical protein
VLPGHSQIEIFFVYIQTSDARTTMTRDDLAKLVLMEIDRQCEAVRSRPSPPAWKRWEVEDHDLDLRYGPSYTPAWFGELTATEAGRVRVLRTVYRLSAGGLLILAKSEGGRLERVRLTPSGREVVAELRGESAPVPT